MFAKTAFRIAGAFALCAAASFAVAQTGPANPMDQGKPGTPANQGVQGGSNANATNTRPQGKRNPAHREPAASAAAASAPAKK